jgi:hypothetical protein
MAIRQEEKGINREFVKRYANAERKQQTKRRNTTFSPSSIPRLVGMQSTRNACTPDIISMAWSCIDEIDHLSRHIHTGTWAPFQDTASLYVSDYVCTCPALPLFTSLHRRRRPVTTRFCLVVVSVLYLACPPSHSIIFLQITTAAMRWTY